KLFSFSLSPEEWEVYQSREKEIQKIKQRIKDLADQTGKADDPALDEIDANEIFKLLSSFSGFNDAAIARNAVLVDNLLQKAVPNSPQQFPIAVLVAGG